MDERTSLRQMLRWGGVSPAAGQVQQNILLEEQPVFCSLDGTSILGQLWNPSVQTSGKLMRVGDRN